jgi:hypothetical protein
MRCRDALVILHHGADGSSSLKIESLHLIFYKYEIVWWNIQSIRRFPYRLIFEPNVSKHAKIYEKPRDFSHSHASRDMQGMDLKQSR